MEPLYVQFLEDNADKKVKTILDEVKELCSAKSGGGGGAASTFVKDGDEVVAVKCYYHGTWMDPRIVPFGAKANSATGLNNMCKAGVSKWTKQQRAFTKGKDDLLTRVTEGNLAADDIGKEMDKLKIRPTEAGLIRLARVLLVFVRLGSLVDRRLVGKVRVFCREGDTLFSSLETLIVTFQREHFLTGSFQLPESDEDQ